MEVLGTANLAVNSNINIGIVKDAARPLA